VCSSDLERLWVTTSLRGMVAGVLRVDVLTEGVHSGSASGVVPSSFRIARRLLDRLEDSDTGRLLLPELFVEVPEDRVAQATATAAGYPVAGHFPWAGGTQPMSADPTEQWLGRTWQPTLSITGVDGIPPAGRAGNVLRPYTSLKLSFRLPPTCDPKRALQAIQECLLADPPHGATVQFLDASAEPGWNAPTFSPWLQAALDEASDGVFGSPSMAFGEGGSIPFMGMLGKMFPAAQFVITGALLPGANAHGPNEFLHLPTAVRLTECLSLLLRAHATR
jgi:acetylornithine deacetylase/succinyl-diaminopimelate desuccinylase-like protein